MKIINNKNLYKTFILSFALTLLPFVTISDAAASKPLYDKARESKVTDLQSLTFRSSYLSVNGKRYELSSKKPISISFTEKTISITAGCNTLGGNYSLSKGIIKAQTIFNTKKSCSEKLINQDLWLNQLFSSKPKITVQNISARSKVKTPVTILTIESNLTPMLKVGKSLIKMYIYETYGYADTPLGDENSNLLVKKICTEILLNKATETEAQFTAEQNALIFRVVSREGEDYIVTKDYRVNRINVSILEGKVSSCSTG
jgi:heat shock protein HslJ